MKTTTKYTAHNTKLFPWSGSKAKYNKQFQTLHKKISTKSVDTYIEAFAGTLASLFHNLEAINAKKIIINDINIMLVNLYIQIKNNPQNVLSVFKMLENTFQEHIPADFKGKGIIKDKALREEKLGHLRDFYNQARNYFNKKELSAQSAGVMIFLLNHNFNGIYKVGKDGSYCTAFNWNMNKVNITAIEENLINLHNFFTEYDIVIENMDVLALADRYKNEKNTLIYLDPPYVDSKLKYNSNHTADYNCVEAHIALIEACKRFDYVIYSNNLNEILCSLFDTQIEFARTNTITQNGAQKNSKIEMLCFLDNTAVSMPSVEELIASISFFETMPSVETILYGSTNNSDYASAKIA